jgi:hypothetical protein
LRRFEAEIKAIEERIAMDKAEYQKKLNAIEKSKRDMENTYESRL